MAFGLENLGLDRDQIRQRVDEALDHLGILHLRDRKTFLLSGGEKQKAAETMRNAMQMGVDPTMMGGGERQK